MEIVFGSNELKKNCGRMFRSILEISNTQQSCVPATALSSEPFYFVLLASWKPGQGVLDTRLGVLEAGLGVLEVRLGILEARLGVLEA